MDSLCSCQPKPRIPRPRNAFFLYREAHYKAVVASAEVSPLPSTTVAKILGRQWRDLPESAKAEWKELAEEEKRQHKQRYPDYKYCPSSRICSQCGGRQIRGAKSHREGSSGSPARVASDEIMDLVSSREMMSEWSDYSDEQVCQLFSLPEKGEDQAPRPITPSPPPFTTIKPCLLEKQHGRWTLCSILLPTDHGYGSQVTLFDSCLTYRMLHVVGRMAITTGEAYFTLTDDTIRELAKYYNSTCTDLSRQQRFLAAAYTFRYSVGYNEILDALEDDGSGELKVSVTVTQVTVLVTVTTIGTGVLLVELRIVVEGMMAGEGALLEGGELLRNNAVLEEAIPVLALLFFEGVDIPFLEQEEGIISGHVKFRSNRDIKFWLRTQQEQHKEAIVSPQQFPSNWNRLRNARRPSPNPVKEAAWDYSHSDHSSIVALIGLDTPQAQTGRETFKVGRRAPMAENLVILGSDFLLWNGIKRGGGRHSIHGLKSSWCQARATLNFQDWSGLGQFY
ncbi:hypothetical protein BDV11DRAFT_204315 [Aspergillus similis]